MSPSRRENEAPEAKADVTGECELTASDHGQVVVSDEDYERAAQSAIAGMKLGFHMGGGPYVRREELHERKALRDL